jgi:hypothetical protein
MTAAEVKIKAVWNSIPDSIRSKIQYMAGCGSFYTYFYKSLTPEIFNDIDTILLKLQLLGYEVEYGKVNIEDDNEAVGISTDTKLTIKW